MPVMTWSGFYVGGHVGFGELDIATLEWELWTAEGDLADFAHDVFYGDEALEAPEGAVGSLPAGLVATPTDGSQPMVATSPIWLFEDDGRVTGTGPCLCGGTPWQRRVGAEPVPVELGVTEASIAGANAYLVSRFGGLQSASGGVLAPPVAPDEAARGDGIDPDSELAKMARALGIRLEGLTLVSAQHSWWIHATRENLAGQRWGWSNARASLIDAGASPEAADGAREAITSPGWVEPRPSIMDALPSNLVIS